MSAGTARNLPFYPKQQLTSLTLTDSSRGMLFFARDKAARRPMGVPVAVHQCDARRLAAHPGMGFVDAAGAQAVHAQGGTAAGPGVDSRREAAAAVPPPAEPAGARAADAKARAAPAGAAAGPQAALPSAGTDPRVGVAGRPVEVAVEVAAVPREGEEAGALVPALRVFEPGTFTTVVDTFGLCSHSDPVGTLRVRPRLWPLTACNSSTMPSVLP